MKFRLRVRRTRCRRCMCAERRRRAAALKTGRGALDIRDVPLAVCFAPPRCYGRVPLLLSISVAPPGATRTVQYSKLLAVTTPT